MVQIADGWITITTGRTAAWIIWLLRRSQRCVLSKASVPSAFLKTRIIVVKNFHDDRNTIRGRSAGNMTASAAEDFLIGDNSVKDVVTIGQITAGFSGIPLFIELPGEDFALITTTKETSENGNNIRYGIKPDIEFQLTFKDIIEN